MATIAEYLKWAETFNNQLENGTLLQDIIEANEPFIVDCVTDKQLYDKGINALGVEISSYMPYRPLTIEIKSAKGQPTDRVTLKDTGDFYKSVHVKADKTYFEVVASDWKADELLGKYGDDILGLTSAHKQELIWQKIYPALLQQARGLILGGKDDLPE